MISTLNLKARDFKLRALNKNQGNIMAMEKTITEFPKWVAGKLCKDADEEAAVEAGGDSSAKPTMTKPKPPKRKNGRRL